MVPICQRWEKGSRYYQIDVCLDLWGEWTLIQQWGRCNSRLGQSRSILCASYADALARVARIEQRRKQRHYYTVDLTRLI